MLLDPLKECSLLGNELRQSSSVQSSPHRVPEKGTDEPAEQCRGKGCDPHGRESIEGYDLCYPICYIGIGRDGEHGAGGGSEGRYDGRDE